MIVWSGSWRWLALHNIKIFHKFIATWARIGHGLGWISTLLCISWIFTDMKELTNLGELLGALVFIDRVRPAKYTVCLSLRMACVLSIVNRCLWKFLFIQVRVSEASCSKKKYSSLQLSTVMTIVNRLFHQYQFSGNKLGIGHEYSCPRCGLLFLKVHD